MTSAPTHAEWLALDHDSENRKQLQRWIESDDPVLAEQLRDAFDGWLTFGTAGLRGPMGPGPNRMNCVTVRHASVALAARLDATDTPGPVVVGFDARRHSETFALEAAQTLAGSGRLVLLAARPLPTPVIAWATLARGCAAGVMVTASHNPPGDNGFKVYGSDGAQICAPEDEAFETMMRTLDPSAPRASDTEPSLIQLEPSLVEDYSAAASTAVLALTATDPRQASATSGVLKVAYTPLHGVAGAPMQNVVASLPGVTLYPVDAQMQPDGEFPTVDYPNPERASALDLLIAKAADAGADIALAHDPDGDRLGVVIPESGGWRSLTGNEIGSLLADALLLPAQGAFRAGKGNGQQEQPDHRETLVVATIVTSRLVELMARDAGAEYIETLPGFKWIIRPAIRRPDLRLVLGFEEALGFAVWEEVRDKDGITAGLALVHRASKLAAEGLTLADRLEYIARRFGLHASRNWIHHGRLGRQHIVATMDRLRRSRPSVLGDRAVLDIHDFLVPNSAFLPTDALRFDLADGSRVMLRPSGTEPILKTYLNVVVPVASHPGAYWAARTHAASALDELESAIRRIVQTDD